MSCFIYFIVSGSSCFCDNIKIVNNCQQKINKRQAISKRPSKNINVPDVFWPVRTNLFRFSVGFEIPRQIFASSETKSRYERQSNHQFSSCVTCCVSEMLHMLFILTSSPGTSWFYCYWSPHLATTNCKTCQSTKSFNGQSLRLIWLHRT